MSAETPRISIGFPVFNGADFLREALDALLAQDFEDFELIVSDNASTDATGSICREYAQADGRIRYFRADENRGAAWNYNFVFAQARGEFFKWAAHDDVCAPQFLSRCLEVFDRSDDKVVLVYPRATLIDDDGNLLEPDSDRMETRSAFAHRRVIHVLSNVNLANAIFGLIRSPALRRTRLIGPFVASDYVLFVELAILGQFVEVPEELFEKRVHARSSRAANVTEGQVMRWFDPTRRHGRLTTKQRLLVEYTRSALRLSRGPIERALCVSVIAPTMLVRRIRVALGRWRRRLLRRSSPRT